MKIQLLAVVLAALFSQCAFAIQDCPYPAVNAIFNGDLGGGNSAVWIVAGNRSSFLPKSNPDSSQIFAVALAKKMGGGAITIRYTNPIDCNGTDVRGDVIGIWAN